MAVPMNDIETLKMTPEQFDEAYKRACEIIATWPEWKKNILAYSAQPTVNTPRPPIFTDDLY